MHYQLISELVTWVKRYGEQNQEAVSDVHHFSHWLNQQFSSNPVSIEQDWEGKAEGRSSDSVINTSLVHLFRYAKLHAKSAIANTKFSTPDDFIYLVSLLSSGILSKTALIRLNVHEKSAGMQIVNRLIKNGFVEQSSTGADKRSRMIHITDSGQLALNDSMQNIRNASRKVTEPLSEEEKLTLINLLFKLEDFHESEIGGNL